MSSAHCFWHWKQHLIELRLNDLLDNDAELWAVASGGRSSRLLRFLRAGEDVALIPWDTASAFEFQVHSFSKAARRLRLFPLRIGVPRPIDPTRRAGRWAVRRPPLRRAPGLARLVEPEASLPELALHSRIAAPGVPPSRQGLLDPGPPSGQDLGKRSSDPGSGAPDRSHARTCIPPSYDRKINLLPNPGIMTETPNAIRIASNRERGSG